MSEIKQDATSRLAEKSHWDQIYNGQPKPVLPKKRKWRPKSYSGEKYWNLIGKYLPAERAGKQVLEVGCAPGNIVLEFARRFGYAPHGIDYSEEGVSQAKANFRAHTFPAENVLLGDLFDKQFQSSLADRFDVVISCGFIEHFTELTPVIDAHVALLRPGGLLVVTIPNYSGINYAIGHLTVGHLYPKHNLTIMNRVSFRSIFKRPALEGLWCGPCGGFDFGMFDTGANSLVLKAMRPAQAVLNSVFSVLPPPESAWTSPQYLYIGRKKSA